MERSDVVRQLHERLGPVTLSRDQLLDVPKPLLPLFPFGGLPKGFIVGFEGAGSWSVAMSMAATVMGDHGWMGIVGIEEFGLVAAAELGVDLNRVLVVESPASSRLAPAMGALLEAVDVLIVKPRRLIGAEPARRIKAKATEKGRLVFHLDGARQWPTTPDIVVRSISQRWEGLDDGHGHLRHRHLDLVAHGRRSAARGRSTSIIVPGPHGGLATSPPINHSAPAPSAPKLPTKVA